MSALTWDIAQILLPESEAGTHPPGSAYLIGYGLKYLILDAFITASPGSDAAFFLLVSLPAVFSVPILAAEYLEEKELLILNNTIVLHACFTIVLFSAYALLIL